MNRSNVDDDLRTSRDRENSCLTGFIPNGESSVLGTVLYDGRCLGSSTKDYGNSEICVAITYYREHSHGFV